MTVQDPKLPPPAPPQPALPASHPNGKAQTPPPPHAPAKRNTVMSLVIWIIVIGALAVISYFAYEYYVNAKKPAKSRTRAGAIPVVVEKATVGEMKIYVKRIGTVTAYNTVTLRTRVDGQLDKVAFTEGQLVKTGDLLFQIDPRPFQVQLEQAEGQMAKDQATLDNARVDLKRYNDAAAAVSDQIRITAAATVKQDEGTVKTDQSAIDSAKLNIVYCRITAPISGRIGLRAVDEGNMVHAADTTGMAVITQLQPITVIFSPTQNELLQVQKAMLANPHPVVEAWDSDNTTKLADGKLDALDNQIDPTTGTVRIKAVFPNEDNALYPQQFVNAHLLVQSLENVVLVPNAALQTDANNKPFVYVVMPDQTVDMRPVTIGPATDTDTVVLTGVEDGNEVVTAGVDKLEPKSKVVAGSPPGSDTQAATTSGPATRAHTRSGKSRGQSGGGNSTGNGGGGSNPQ